MIVSADDRFDFTPVIIIGAGRSGTNILRDTLCKLDGFATWPCDEINPIWRHGNLERPDDRFGAEHVRPSIRRFIRSRFFRQWRRTDKPPFLVEKTCANSLRVPFVAAILPEAKFIYLVRDGRDVVVSAAKRWRGELELPGLPYYWAKVRNTPMRDLPVYGWRFVKGRLGMIAGKSDRLAFWGPQFPGMTALPADTPLLELCARQWAASVEASDAAFAALSADQWLPVGYEALTSDPVQTIAAICRFLGADIDRSAIAHAAAAISPTSVGRGRAALEGADPAIAAILDPPLLRHGYQG